MASDIFNLNENPFDTMPQPQFFYGDPETESIFDGLLSAVYERKGLALLVGEQGAGKTTLLLKLQEELAARGCLAVFPRCAEPSFDGLLKSCCEQLDIGQEVDDRTGRVTALAELLVAQFDAGGTAAILVDDAQDLPDDALDNFSWLTDLEKADQKLVQIVFAGQPELVPRLCGSQLLFVQDSAIAYSGLKHLDPQEVGLYIQHRLEVAGYDGPGLFSPQAVRRVAEISKGVPRLINQICATSLDMIGPTPGIIVGAEAVEAAVQFLPSLSSSGDGERTEDPGTRDDPELLAGDAFRQDLEIPAPHQETAWVLPGSITGAAPAPSVSAARRRRPFFARLRKSDRDTGTSGAIEPAEDRPEPGLRTAADPAPIRLTFPSDQNSPPPRRGRSVPLVALFLAALVLGGIGMFGFRFWTVPPDLLLLAEKMLADEPEASSDPTESLAETEVAALFTPRALERIVLARATVFTEPADAPEPLSVVEPESILGPGAEADPEAIPEIPGIDLARTPSPPVADAGGHAETATLREIRAPQADSGGPEDILITLSGPPDSAPPSAGRDDGDASSTTARLEVDERAAPAPVADPTGDFTGDFKGDFAIQLASLRSAQLATQEAARLEQHFSELLGDAELKIQQALVDGVSYFRVRTGPVLAKSEAFRMCAELKDSRQDCMVLQRIAALKQPAPDRPGKISADPPQAPEPDAPLSLLSEDMAVVVAALSAAKLAPESVGTPESVAAPAADLDLRRLVTAREVVDREPYDLTTSFSPEDGRAFVHASIRNPGPPTQVSFVWLQGDAIYTTVEMDIGTSVRWRTWSSAEVWPGEWRVQLVTADGEVLGEQAFSVE